MKIIYIIAAMITLMSCKKSSDIGGSIVVDGVLKVSFIDHNKVDLLKALSSESLAKLRLYYIKDGYKVMYHDPRLSDPYGIELITPEDQGSLYQLKLKPYNPGTFGENVSATTYLLWEDGKQDTIIGTFDNNANNYILTKFKFNDVEVDFKDKQGIVINRN